VSNDVNDWLSGGGTPWAKFTNRGDSIEGEITDMTMRRALDFDTREALTWPDGNPRMEAHITLATDQRDDAYEDDDGTRVLVINSANKRAALKDAIAKAKAKGIREGGRLWVQYTGDGNPSRPGGRAPKMYRMAYKPPEFTPEPERSRSEETGWNEQPKRRAPSAEPWGGRQAMEDPPF